MMLEIIAGALIAISARELIRALLGLALVFLGIAGLLASLDAWYLAIGQLFLFIGGIVTFLVLVFNTAKMPISSGHSLPALLVAALVLIVLAQSLQLDGSHAIISASDLAHAFFAQYALLLVPALLLLFAAIIAAQHIMGENT